MLIMQKQSSETEFKKKSSKEKPIPIMENMKEEPKWPSFGQLLIDLSKLALEALVGILLCFEILCDANMLLLCLLVADFVDASGFCCGSSPVAVYVDVICS